MSNIRPCPYCGNGQFLSLQNMALELKQQASVLGLKGYKAGGVHLEVTIMICTTCTRTDLFTTNGRELHERLKAPFVQA